MVFTNLWRSSLVLVLLLSACASPPKVPDAEPAELAEADRSGSALPSGPVTPNPYHQQAVNVSRGAQQAFELALQALEEKDWPRAETRLLAMTEEYPHLSGPWVNLARVYLVQEQEDEAVTALNQALAVNPKNLDAYNQLALIKRETGQFERARELYEQALDVWPFHDTSHRNLGILLDLYLGQGEQALRHYRAYQLLQDEPEREVSGWIVDLERQLNLQATRGE